MRILLGLILAISFASSANAAELKPSERLFINAHFNAVAKTLAHKELPPKFIKGTLGTRSDKDRGILKEALDTWKKNYSPEISYQVSGPTIAVLYKKAVAVKYTITSLKPLMVQINDDKSAVVTVDKSNPLSSLLAALKKQGYQLGSTKKVANIFSLVPEAEAADSAGTWTNPIVIVSDYVSDDFYDRKQGQSSYSGVVDDFTGTAMNETEWFADRGLIYDQWWSHDAGSVFRGANSQKVSCNTDSASGTIVDGRGEQLKFEATRDGVTLTDSKGGTVMGSSEPAKFATFKCSEIERAPNFYIPGGGEYANACSLLKTLRRNISYEELECNWPAKKGECEKVKAAFISPPKALKYCSEPACAKPVVVDIHKSTFESLRQSAIGQDSSDAELTKYSDRDKPDFARLAAAAQGMLDCCHSKKCAEHFKKLNTELAPTDSEPASTYQSPATTEKAE